MLDAKTVRELLDYDMKLAFSLGASGLGSPVLPANVLAGPGQGHRTRLRRSATLP
jgi:hypothetical protein